MTEGRHLTWRACHRPRLAFASVDLSGTLKIHCPALLRMDARYAAGNPPALVRLQKRIGSSPLAQLFQPIPDTIHATRALYLQ